MDALRNIAQRILGHIFAREIAEFACLSVRLSLSLSGWM